MCVCVCKWIKFYVFTACPPRKVCGCGQVGVCILVLSRLFFVLIECSLAEVVNGAPDPCQPSSEQRLCCYDRSNKF